MLTDFAARGFPFFLLGLLGALALWLDQATELPQFAGASKQEPDLIIERFQSVIHGPDGRPLYRLRANSMAHIPADDSAILQQAMVVQTQPQAPDLTIVASQAHILQHGEKINFKEGVILTRAPSALDAELQIKSQQLEWDSLQGVASSQLPVQARRGSDSMQAGAMRYDHRKGLLHLSSHGKLRYESKQP